MRGSPWRHGGLLLALAASGAAVGYQLERQRVGYTAYDLPTFDAYVYMTMADEPAFFTAAPWGYRVLGPRLVHLSPPRRRLIAFRDLAVLSLVAAGGLLFLFLRRLGHGTALSLLAVLAFALSRPVRLALGAPLLGEPLAVALEMAVLLAIAAGAAWPVLAALLAVGVLAKELFLLMPPLLLLSRWPRMPFRRALAAMLLAAAPVYLTHFLLRAWWTPSLRTPSAPLGLELVRAGFEVFRTEMDDTGRALLLMGVTPLALLGALLRESRPYLRVFGYLALGCLAISLTAWVNVPSARPVPLFGANTERILIYALPLLLPLALCAVERGLRLAAAEAAPPAGAARFLMAPAVLVCAACVSFPFYATDRYARLPLHGSRDGPLVMAFCRESLRMARRLERGEEVLLEPQRLRFAWGSDDPARLFEMRWFLRDGWGPLPHYGIHDAVMRGPRASLVLPSLRPRTLELGLRLQSAAPGALLAFVNGRGVGRIATGPQALESVLSVPRDALLRGDNLLTLSAAEGAPQGARLRSYRVRGL